MQYQAPVRTPMLVDPRGKSPTRTWCILPAPENSGCPKPPAQSTGRLSCVEKIFLTTYAQKLVHVTQECSGPYLATVLWAGLLWFTWSFL